MSPLKNVHKSPLLRKVCLPLLKRFNPGDIRIRHHYTREPFHLHCYRHKGYWYHGRRRERRTMDFFAAAIRPGDVVAEVGGHIGYIAAYYASLVGPGGKVVVFEPGSNNLPYLHKNLSSHGWVEIVEQAVSDQPGEATFFEENLTGQNNSLHADYDVFQSNRSRAYDNEGYAPRSVQVTTLDRHFGADLAPPNLIKIDVEGAELSVLHGADRLLTEHQPVVMVEVTREKGAVYEWLSGRGYHLYDDRGRALLSGDDFDFNVCALHPERHEELLGRLGWRSPLTLAQAGRHAAA